MSIRLFSSLVAGRRWRVVLLAVSSIAAALAEALVLVIVVQVALAITDGKDRVDLELGPLDWSVAVGTIFAIGWVLVAVRFALQLVAEYLPARMSTDVQEQLRKTIFERFVRTSWDVQSREREGHLQELLTAQISRVAAAVLLTGEALAQSFNFVTLLISALILNPPAAASIAIAVVALFFVMRPLARLARHQSRQHAAQSVEYAATISESVRVGAEVQAFGVAEQQRRAVDRRVEGISRYLFRTSFLAGLVRAVYQNVAISLVLFGLAVVYLTGSKEVASLGAVALILIRALGYSQGAQSYYHRANELVPYIERINERQSLYEANRVRSGDRPLARIDELGFDGVSFEYEVGMPVLRNVTFRIPHGEATGLIGPTGAGKSTLVQIILRLREPSAGELLVNGQPSANFRLEDWRRLVAFLPQDPQLLNGTVSENIRFLREDIGDEEVERAARLAHIHDEICSWPNGYRTVVGQRAHAVSGGQRQRICLARALVTRPSVLVLDEPTSALDVRSESLIQRSLAASKSEMTIVCIAHRLSTLNLCDRIIVLREGELEAFDTPESLVRSNGFYREAVELSRLP